MQHSLIGHELLKVTQKVFFCIFEESKKALPGKIQHKFIDPSFFWYKLIMNKDLNKYYQICYENKQRERLLMIQPLCNNVS